MNKCTHYKYNKKSTTCNLPFIKSSGIRDVPTFLRAGLAVRVHGLAGPAGSRLARVHREPLLVASTSENSGKLYSMNILCIRSFNILPVLFFN